MPRTRVVIESFRDAPVLFIFSHGSILSTEPIPVPPNRFIVQTGEICRIVTFASDDPLIASFQDYEMDNTMDVLLGRRPISNVSRRERQFWEMLDPKFPEEPTQNKYLSFTETDLDDPQGSGQMGIFRLNQTTKTLEKEAWMFPVEERMLVKDGHGGAFTSEILEAIESVQKDQPLILVFSGCSTVLDSSIPEATARVGKEVGAVSGRYTVAEPTSLVERERLGLPMNARWKRNTVRRKNRGRKHTREISQGVSRNRSRSRPRAAASRKNRNKPNNNSNLESNNNWNNPWSRPSENTERVRQPGRASRREESIDLFRFLVQYPDGSMQTQAREGIPIEIRQKEELRDALTDPDSDLVKDHAKIQNRGGKFLIQRIQIQGRKHQSDTQTWEEFHRKFPSLTRANA